MYENKTRLIIDVEFPIGTVVYHRTLAEAHKGIVICLLLRPCGIVYVVQWGETTEHHYAFELSGEFVKDYGEGS